MVSEKYVKHTNSFEAYDAAGDSYTINVLTTFIVARSRAGSQDIPGMKTLKTDDGEHVNRIDKGKYELVNSGLELLSDDPNAE